MNIIEAGLKFNGESGVRSTTNGFVLHHAAAANASVATVHQWHLDRGWIGIGYHFYVRKDGSVYRGRPENWIGAHTSGHNSTKIGICAEGNFQNEGMPVAQKNAIIELLWYLRDKYGDKKVYGHRDLDATACPGANYPFNEIVNAKRPGTSTEAEDKNDDVLYRVQTGAYSALANAIATQAKLKAAGFDTYLVRADDGLYKVQTGAFKNRDNANNLVNKLNSAGFAAFITTKSGVHVNGEAASKPVEIVLKNGDRVRMEYGAPVYGMNYGFQGFVYNSTLYVREVNGDKVVISTTASGAITGAVHKKFLTKI